MRHDNRTPDEFVAAQSDWNTPIKDAPGDNKLFDITCTVGSVYSSELGDMSPRAAAFLLIGRYGGDGEFRFPNEDGSITLVGVVTETARA